MTPATVGALLAWGTVVGVDLVSVPQGMLARPLVAAAVAGLLVGDPAAGVRLGVVLELFALDVLPVGAVRYPDYGPAAVAATALVAGRPWEEALGVGVALGLVLAALGGWTLPRLREANARATAALAGALAAGDAGAIRRVQYGGIARDALRAAATTGLGLAAALALGAVTPRLPPATAGQLSWIAVGGGLAAALGGALRIAGRTARLLWLAVGLAAGLAWGLVG